ncbi:1,4-dihydroxy-2-naphthoyl-CoA synthase [Roseomonas eburnea]|jgi:dihydroxynaphthoic acid synthetase|uniref:1,4-dihydroxy-2-naphthoyl-CoA synthase n=1 Tax=Neoroseomonas eburnea TaxID=1346889 RepID=A0A9X9XEH4_9PROT|nr:enoyl-CoA hydratase-related protein [Neoroseomonas eburnea]MBR0682110.1 1,4-dihydroxy-2-naphthoyl-CoA synthase [Neoroseomonas eburnea]
MDYTDILYAVEDSTAIITINRPDRYNSFRGRTVEELINALQRAWVDKKVACVILTGAGNKAFCTGGDQKEYVETGGYGTSANGLWEVETLQNTIRDIPKPVIAAVNGFAIGGGHVLHVLCDLTIASDNARFGQAGPRVGSFDAGWGTALLTRIVGEKKAREIWFLCRQYTAEEAKEMGLVNKVVPQAQLMAEAKGWAAEIAALSPTAIKFLKYSFNADSAHAYGTTKMAMSALDGFGHTEEAMEGKRAFVEKRKPDFSPFR